MDVMADFYFMDIMADFFGHNGRFLFFMGITLIPLHILSNFYVLQGHINSHVQKLLHTEMPPDHKHTDFVVFTSKIAVK